eukprot:TRINITY_DN13131_c0_g1_i1.p1 TRINITY_DN13131_c0_g1~~TRINITY_DN13131_c0_g1_i1.p1  ORF type:complete len:286 (+),score=49.48 TRINITY_DN13131_c0_g1_i1:47-904(+)
MKRMSRLLAVGQLTSTSNVNQNFKSCAVLVEKAISRGCSLLCLPEAFDYISTSSAQSLELAQDLESELMTGYRNLAKQGIWLSLGGWHEKIQDNETHFYNTHIIIDDKGELRSSYRKLHLFDVDIPNGPVLKESNNTKQGELLEVCPSPVGNLGLSICYDLRFPEQYIALTKMGAEVLLVPAAFTLTTGKDHWEVLLRARAIENQCYVAAAAQIGKHNEKRESFGHAMIIDPWGRVVACCSDRTDQIAVAEIDLDYIKDVRTRMPVYQHRRSEIYGDVENQVNHT